MTPLSWERAMLCIGRINRHVQQFQIVTDLLYTLSRSVISLSAIGVSFGHDLAEKKEWSKTKDEVLHPDAVGELVRKNMAANAQIVFRANDPDADPDDTDYIH